MQDNYINFNYFCDICNLEINSVRIKNSLKPEKPKTFFNKIINSLFEEKEYDPALYWQIHQWYIYKVKNFEIIKTKLLEFLKSQINYDIPLQEYERLINKDHIFICKSHLNNFKKYANLDKGWYCTNCGQEYSLEDSEKFQFRFGTGLFYVNCKNCNELAIANKITAEIKTIYYLLSCVNCKKDIAIDINKCGEANPYYIFKNCPYCGGKLQGIEVVKYVWSSKKLIRFNNSDRYEKDDDILSCSYYHNKSNISYCPICGKKLK